MCSHESSQDHDPGVKVETMWSRASKMISCNKTTDFFSHRSGRNTRCISSLSSRRAVLSCSMPCLTASRWEGWRYYPAFSCRNRSDRFGGAVTWSSPSTAAILQGQERSRQEYAWFVDCMQDGANFCHLKPVGKLIGVAWNWLQARGVLSYSFTSTFLYF